MKVQWDRVELRKIDHTLQAPKDFDVVVIKQSVTQCVNKAIEDRQTISASADLGVERQAFWAKGDIDNGVRGDGKSWK